MQQNSTLTFPVYSLTPIWTGDVGRTSSAVRPTGLLGSMRVWYEGIVRGMGGTACDPTQHQGPGQACTFDADAYEKAQKNGYRGAALLAEAGLCPACQMFGANGWQRRFRLAPGGFTPHPVYFVASPKMAQAAGNWLWRIFGTEERDGTTAGHRADTFTFNVQSLWAENGRLEFTTLGADYEETRARLAYLLYLMARYGAIGAKTQNGFGQFMVGGLTPALVQRGHKLVARDVQASQPRGQPPNAFSLGSFFSIVYELDDRQVDRYKVSLYKIGDAPAEDQLYIPCAFDVRYKSVMGDIKTGAGAVGMRPTFRRIWGRSATNLLLGETKPRSEADRSGSRIHVSHIYRLDAKKPWRLKVWGYVPPGLVSDDAKYRGLADVVATIDDFIAGPGGMFPHGRRVVEFVPQEVQ